MSSELKKLLNCANIKVDKTCVNRIVLIIANASQIQNE